ncbi:MAG: ATP-binding cassette domain-containing protein [Chitinivibrionales bacterium]|nr:ATP-binding cassette domain-containing protein [Chitinivibrionales bacterium]MBD3358778.1 ATP-binding cassette domain-containing protein [Chitinivibrionales bacterium]
MSNGKVVSLYEVSKQYRRGAETVHALRDVTLDIAAGEYVAIAGHSGSGKTTLLNLIGCLDRPTSGRIAVDGHELRVAGEKELNRLRQTAVGFVFQQFFLIPTLTVIENVQLPALFTGRKVDKRARELLELVGLSKRMHHLPGQLSGGEMQRVAVARSLINSPPILLADEPTGNLDSRNADMIIELFETLNRDGMTVVLVTHNLDLVKRCGRAVYIEDGMVKV